MSQNRIRRASFAWSSLSGKVRLLAIPAGHIRLRIIAFVWSPRCGDHLTREEQNHVASILHQIVRSGQ